MISKFLQMGIIHRRARLARAIAGVCVVLWVAGSISTLYGCLAPQWTTPHCPQSQSNNGPHTLGSCAWHCDGFGTQSSSDPWGPSIAAIGYLFGDPADTIGLAILQNGKVIRGPPDPIVSVFVSAM